MEKELIRTFDQKYIDYLSDESGLVGKAESISFPQNEDEAREVINQLYSRNTPVTIQGGRTGLAGCAVPIQGHILNLSRMNRVKEYMKSGAGDHLLVVEPGLTLEDLRRAIKALPGEEELFWPPDPTETTATAGGIISCNARGISSHYYGETRQHVSALRVLKSGGTIAEIKRGDKTVPFLGGHMDLLDLVIGSEGMLGVITGLTLKLQPRPPAMWGFMLFFKEQDDLFRFTGDLEKNKFRIGEAGLAVAEYMDRVTIELLQQYKDSVPPIKVTPGIPEGTGAMVYLEVHSVTEDNLENVAATLIDMVETYNCDPDQAWAVTGEAEIEKIRAIRHAASECTNRLMQDHRLNQPQLMKLETYIRREDESFKPVVKTYEEDLSNEGLKGAIFGHIAGSHLHANILPEDYMQYEKGLKLLEKWAREAGKKKEKACSQHGVGKLKKSMFQLMAPAGLIEELKQVKNSCDRTGLWNPGNMF